jgi:hypothetical protein
MTPGEVQGLQSLALAAGGSLTVNPDTGLVEANFLKKLLPTLLGFGLNFLIPGLGALGSGLLVGAGETIRTGGDLGKGLMAGLGAFGGAGLGSALAGAGAVAGGAGQSAITAAGEAAAKEAATKGLETAAVEAAKKKAIEEATKKAIAEQAANKAVSAGSTGFQNLKTGVSNLFSTKPGIGALGGMDAFGGTFNALPGGMIGKAGLITSTANALTPDMEVPEGAYNIDDSYYQSYGYDPAQGRFLGGQWQKGYPGFPGYAMGGQVSPPPNYSYPQAGITKSNYAPSLEYAKPREILDGYDTKIDPFTGAEGFADGGGVGVAPEQNIQAQMGPQSLEQYYQSLLSAPQAPAADPAFANYLQGFNKFVTSPVAPPPPPAAAPPGTPTTPGGGTTPTPGGGQRWDPTLGKFVPNPGSAGDSYTNLSDLADLVNSGTFPGMNFGDLGNYLQNGGYGDTSGLTYDPTSGTFRQPGKGSDLEGGYNAFNVDMGDYGQGSDLEGGYNAFNVDMTGYGQEAAPTAATAGKSTSGITAGSILAKSFRGEPLTAEEQAFADQMDQQPQQINTGYDPIAARNALMPQGGLTPIQDIFTPGGPGSPVAPLSSYGDMTPYGTEFQGFQPYQTDFGSTYQAPAMQTPSLDMMAYSQQPTDFGSMGNYGLGALGTTYQAPTFQMPSTDFASQTPAIPTTSFSTPMTTGMPSTGATAPQYGFGNSDVMYGQSAFGGNEPNIFGFAGGGTIQKAAAGKLVTGDGDGMSDDIRANINGNQEARLADGEFVIPADVVSHLGNGSTDAGADRLYSMMDRIRKARTGRKQQAPEIDAEKYLPA